MIFTLKDFQARLRRFDPAAVAAAGGEPYTLNVTTILSRKAVQNMLPPSYKVVYLNAAAPEGRVKVADLIGPDLDAWVARAEGHTITAMPNSKLRVTGDDRDFPGLEVFLGYIGDCAQPWAPSILAAQGQPIMERKRISTRWDDETLYSVPQNRWLAEQSDLGGAIDGPTMLIAGMRARVAQVYGDEVPACTS